MKKIFLILFAIGMTAMSSTSMAAMSNSRIRTETRFLTDKMAYELNLSTAQYNDAYEINYDFIYSIRYLMDDVTRGYEWALDDYYSYLDVRNDDLRWVLSDTQYRRFMQADYFYRPIYASGGKWNFRIYITYTNHHHFYFPKPYHYRSYCGGHYRTHYHNGSYYRGRYNHNYYSGNHSVRHENVYRSNRRSDFGSVSIRPNTSTRPGTSSRPETTTRPGTSVPSRREDASSSRGESSSSNRESTTSSRKNTSSGSTETRKETTSPGSTSGRSTRNTSTSGSQSDRRRPESSSSGSSSGSSSSSSNSSSERGSGSSRR